MKKHEDLELLNAELEMIIETALDEIFVTDQNGYITRVNSAGRKYYDLHGKELIGMNVAELYKKE